MRFKERLRTVGTVAYLVFVIFVIFIGVTSVFNTHDANRQNSVLLQRLDDQQKSFDERQRAAADAQHSSDQRQTLILTQQGELLRKYTDLERSNRRLLRWLRLHGVQIPDRYITNAAAKRVPTSPQTSSPNHVNVVAPPPKVKHHNPPKSVSSVGAPSSIKTLPNGKPAPGNSGNAPGHNKH